MLILFLLILSASFYIISFFLMTSKPVLTSGPPSSFITFWKLLFLFKHFFLGRLLCSVPDLSPHHHLQNKKMQGAFTITVSAKNSMLIVDRLINKTFLSGFCHFLSKLEFQLSLTCFCEYFSKSKFSTAKTGIVPLPQVLTMIF